MYRMYLLLCAAILASFVDGRILKVCVYALPPILILQNLAIYLWRARPPWRRITTHAIRVGLQGRAKIALQDGGGV